MRSDGYAVPDDLAFHFVGHGVPNLRDLMMMPVQIIRNFGKFRNRQILRP